MVDNRYPNEYRKKITDGTALNTDRLYKNDWDSALGHPVFKNVSKEAGILMEGFGLGINIADINQDGWKDIYITNDYLSEDLLWINNKNGTFTNKASIYFKHTSASAMGNDIADINNDGLMDVIAVDMLPEDNYRKKMMLPANNYTNYINNELYDYQHQYARNTLQLNQGVVTTNNPSEPLRPVFSEIGFYAGIAETDWSWAPLVADFDNDGWRDIVITNGFPKDVTDRDFMIYQATTSKIASKDQILEQIPAVKLSNYAFKSNGNLTFNNVTEQWGLQQPCFSSGAAYGDLDNDGDLDIVINNTNEEAHVYENTLMEDDTNSKNYLKLNIQGDSLNKNGLGAVVQLYYGNGKIQAYEHSPYRGYLSTVSNQPFFGLGNEIKIVDSIIITWPGFYKQVVKNIPTNQVLRIVKKNAVPFFNASSSLNNQQSTLLYNITETLRLQWNHQEKDFIDFNVQRLLPHKLSQYGPALAVADVDNNGLEDIFIGGARGFSGMFLLQQQSGFLKKQLHNDTGYSVKLQEDMGALLFDADNDSDQDLYIVSGGYESTPLLKDYQDRLYINDGKGNFKYDSLALPFNATSKSCVKACDFDKDGDLDLFVGGRVLPGGYPQAVSSAIYQNNSKPGSIQFTDITSTVATSLKTIGMVSDALWTDIDNDGWMDLFIVGDWMSPTIYRNNKGVLKNNTAGSGLGQATGWWTSLAAGDFDNDGDMDYIAGNAGENTLYKASKAFPVKIYAGDFNKDGAYDAFTTLFLKGKNSQRAEYPAMGRDDWIEQMIALRRRFPDYRSFANASIKKVFTKEELDSALKLTANVLQTCYIKNVGKGKFELLPLPAQAQFSCVFSILPIDADNDGNLDVLINGNDFGVETGVGRNDALNGLLLRCDGTGQFTATTPGYSGFYVPGDGKALVMMRAVGSKPVIIASQNKGPLVAFGFRCNNATIALSPFDEYALIRYNNGKTRKEEFYYGNSFFSQHGRFMTTDTAAKQIEIVSSIGLKRKITFQ
jgi:hypothetical protein